MNTELDEHGRTLFGLATYIVTFEKMLGHLNRIGYNLQQEGYVNDARRLHSIGETLLRQSEEKK